MTLIHSYKLLIQHKYNKNIDHTSLLLVVRMYVCAGPRYEDVNKHTEDSFDGFCGVRHR